MAQEPSSPHLTLPDGFSCTSQSMMGSKYDCLSRCLQGLALGLAQKG